MKNNPENFEREKSPNIQFPETKSHFPTMLISQSAFYAPQKKLHLQWFCSRERWTQTTWMESTAWFHFSRNLHRFDHLVQYKFIYIYISNLIILYKLQKIYDSHCCWVWRGNRYLNQSLKLCFFEKCVIQSQQHF